jgi:hypothetical protein
MNIPLDRLYHYIENIAQEIYGDCIIIYRFWPHGSKNIEDLNNLNKSDGWFEKNVFPALWCNDQEPLDHKFYSTNLRFYPDSEWDKILDLYGFGTIKDLNKNLNYNKNIFEKNLLLHSEKRSQNVKLYYQDNELIPVYYWSHAIIARDWFRYAEHETFQKNTKKTFLIYNRAWSGTREYRLRFSDLLIERVLVDQCQTNCNPVDLDLTLHYSDHIFKNTQWQPTHVLENFLQPTTADSNSSADFDTDDYNSTDIEVVLETLFDDDRLHLTEKSLRPIACGQPFILTGTHGSLEYLRGYGFKTFDTIWDESYDQITDPEKRLISIVNLMQQITGWDSATRINKMSQAKSIADYNRRWFFSKDFFDIIVNELKTNLKSAFEELEQCNNYRAWIDRWQDLTSHSAINDFLNVSQVPTKESIETIMHLAKNQLAKKNRI